MLVKINVELFNKLMLFIPFLMLEIDNCTLMQTHLQFLFSFGIISGFLNLLYFEIYCLKDSPSFNYYNIPKRQTFILTYYFESIYFITNSQL